MPIDKLKKTGLVAELTASIEKQTQQQQQQGAEDVYKALIETPEHSFQEMPSTSQTPASDSIYAKLKLNPTQSPSITEKDSTEYSEILFTGYIKQSKKLLRLAEDIKVIDRKIAGIGKLKEIKQSEKNLSLIEEELTKTQYSKLNLNTELLSVRVSLNKEFAKNFKLLKGKEAELEGRIDDTHGDVDKYNQLKSELFNTRNEHIYLIEKKRETEQALLQISQEGLKTEIEKQLFTLNQEELGLQCKIQKSLSDDKAAIEQNFQLHVKETPEFKQFSEEYIKTVNTLETCVNRISALENEISLREVEFIEIGAVGSSRFLSVLEENPCYEREQGPQAQVVDTNLPGPAVDRGVKSDKGDFSKEDQDLVEQRQKIGDKKNRVKFTDSTIKRDDLKEKQKKETSKPEQSAETAKPTTLRSRLEEFSTIWQTPEDKVDLVTTPASNTEKDTHGPSVDRNRKRGPVVQRELKPSRLAQSNLFSPSSASLSSNVQDEKEKEKIQKQAFAHR